MPSTIEKINESMLMENTGTTRYVVKIKSIFNITHDVLKIITEKPFGYTFMPGQATEISINKTEWQERKKPFTFTNLPDDDFLEFIIKAYPQRHGMTNELLQLKKNDELILHKLFGAISFVKDGIFIAGGSGITPFISIFRDLEKKNKIGNNTIVFANKTKSDIILEDEFTNMLGKSFINILSDENFAGYYNGIITDDFLKRIIPDFSKTFYVCGPPPMMNAVLKQLSNLGVLKSSIIKEGI